MLGTRREEYGGADGGLPFTLFQDIERTPDTQSGERNWHGEPELQLCREGRGEVVIDGVSHPFEVGDVILVPPDAIHYTRAEGRLRYTCLILHTSLGRMTDIDLAALGVPSRIHEPRLAALFDALESAVATEPPFRTARALRAVLDILLSLAESAVTERKQPQGHSFPEVREVIGIIRAEYASRLTLSELARRVYTDKYALARGFKRATGETVITYLNRYRCLVAAERLAEGATVAEAAHAVGFENVSFFIKTFKKFTNALPSTYKARKSRNG